MPSISEFFAHLFHPNPVRRGSSRSIPERGPDPAAAGTSSMGVHLTTTGLRETDNIFYPGSNLSSLYRNRYDYDRQTILSECLRSWRINPISRRIVKLISMFVVGEGITVKSDHKATNDYLQTWWNHPLNHLGRKCVSFCDEATRSGNLFFLCTVDQNTGMLYVRAVPADQIEEIITAENDIDQELAYKPIKQGAPLWPAYNPLSPPAPALLGYSGELTANSQSLTANSQELTANFMLHYAYNQPVGVSWGEPDLAPMLPWIGHYSSWLEDRARLNRFRFSWLIVWKRKWENEAAKLAKNRELAANPPLSGSWLLLDPDETVEMPAPNLESGDAEKDGLALKKMIAIGAGFPTHYLAEPESSTRTTAEAAGTPTFRGLEQTQQFFLDILSEIAAIAVSHRKQFDRRVNPDSKIQAVGPDITERDNSSLALAVSRVYPAFSELFDREGIDEDELLRVVYRMMGDSVVPRPSSAVPMKRRPLKPVSTSQQPAGRPVTPGAGNAPKDPGDPEPNLPSDEQ